MVSKRKRNVLSLERKLDIIAQVRKGKLQRAVAKLFDAAKSTVGDIWKNREKIERHVLRTECHIIHTVNSIITSFIF